MGNAMPDAVDSIVEQWRVVRPDLADELPIMGLLGRIQRLGRVVDRELNQFFSARGVQYWETDVLFTLRRAPGPLTPGALIRASMVTSGTITNRIDRMEARGLVRRTRDSEDRRSVRIELTDEGRDLVDGVIRDHLANYRRLVSSLDPTQRDTLDVLLRTLLMGLGDTELG
jgi:DNA-binding MarR family transcriptional regulator